MTTVKHGAVPGAFKSFKASITAALTTSAVMLVEPQAAQAQGALAPLLYGGGTVISATVASSDTAAQNVILWAGTVVTTQDAAATGAMTTTTNNTINRANNSFITDGWRVGQKVMAFAPPNAAPNAAVDGIVGIITGVAAGALTVNGTPFANLTLAAGTRLCRVAQKFRAPVAAGAGTNGSSANVSLLGNAYDASNLTTEIKLGATDLLAVSSAATITALPCSLDFEAQIAGY